MLFECLCLLRLELPGDRYTFSYYENNLHISFKYSYVEKFSQGCLQ